MTDLRAAAQAVVDAYEASPNDIWSKEQDYLEDAIDALRAALAQPTPPLAVHGYTCGTCEWGRSPQNRTYWDYLDHRVSTGHDGDGPRYVQPAPPLAATDGIANATGGNVVLRNSLTIYPEGQPTPPLDVEALARALYTFNARSDYVLEFPFNREDAAAIAAAYAKAYEEQG